MTTGSDPNPTQATDERGPWNVPRETTPVWESELLLSIGLVVGLSQLPGFVDLALLEAIQRFGESLQPVAIYGFIYTKTALYALITTFIVHLLLRGFWVAALGTRAVFPGGPDWDAVRAGRLAKAMARRHAVPLGTVAERCDNAASLVFAFGFVLFGMTMTILVITVVGATVGALVAALIPGVSALTVGGLLMGLLLGPFMLAQLIDRFFPRWVPVGGLMERILNGALLLGQRATSWPTVGALLLTITTRIGRHRGTALVIIALYLLLAVVAFEALALRGRLDLDSYHHFGRDGGVRMVDPRHYASQRLDATHRLSDWPFIQADIIREPYIRLFVPYGPRRLNSVIEESCPAVQAIEVSDVASEGQRRQAILDCVASIYAPTLNGAPIAGLAFDFATDPASGLGGFVAYIAVDRLNPGRHEIILELPKLKSDPPPAPTDDARYRIPFWR
jgi:hypothetical protein